MTEALSELKDLPSWWILPAAILYILAIGETRNSIRYFLGGVFLHSLNIAQRGISLGWLPLAEKHDTISFFALSTALCILYTYRKARDARIVLLGSPVVVTFLFISFLSRVTDDISPFLRSPWFFAHSLTYFGSFGFLACGGILGILYLKSGSEPLEQLQYRMLIHGWMLYTISLVLGSLWFFIAYGTYWLWTSKELWSTLTWFYLGMYAHARLMKGLRGMPAAAMGVLSIAFALFTYFGVGIVIPSPPTAF